MTTLAHALEQLASEPARAVETLWAEAAGLGVSTVEGQALYHEGDPPDAVYLLLEGRMIGFLSAADEGSEQISIYLEAPAIVGDREILFGLASQETIACLCPCRILTFSSEELPAAYAAAPVERLLALDLAARFASHLQMAWIQRQNMSRRMHYLLSALATDGGRLEALPSPERLVGYLRANPRTVQRALKSLRDDGLLRESERIELTPPDPPLALPFFHALCKRTPSNTPWIAPED